MFCDPRSSPYMVIILKIDQEIDSDAQRPAGESVISQLGALLLRPHLVGRRVVWDRGGYERQPTRCGSGWSWEAVEQPCHLTKSVPGGQGETQTGSLQSWVKIRFLEALNQVWSPQCRLYGLASVAAPPVWVRPWPGFQGSTGGEYRDSPLTGTPKRFLLVPWECWLLESRFLESLVTFIQCLKIPMGAG